MTGRQMNSLVQTQRTFFRSGTTLDVSTRSRALIKLKNCITKYEKEIITALKKDLG